MGLLRKVGSQKQSHAGMGFVERSVQTDAPTSGGLSERIWTKSRLSQGLAPVPLEDLMVLPDKSGRKLEFETTGTRSSYKELALHSQGAFLAAEDFHRAYSEWVTVLMYTWSVGYETEKCVALQAGSCNPEQ